MTHRKPPVIKPLRERETARDLRRVFVRDLVVSGRIGVYDRERDHPQRIRINLDLMVHEGASPVDDCLDNVLCYEQIVVKIRSIVQDGHVNLVETLAERIAAICLQDRRVASVSVRVEKLDVFDDVGSVGVEIERRSAFS